MLDKTMNEAETDQGQDPWALVSRRVVTPSGIRAAAVLIAGETIVDVIEPEQVAGVLSRRGRGRSGRLAGPR